MSHYGADEGVPQNRTSSLTYAVARQPCRALCRFGGKTEAAALVTEELVFYVAMSNGLLLAQEAETSEPAGSAFASLFMIALIIGGGYFLFIRPQRRRMRAMEDLRSSIDVGSEVRTVGGIYGTVVEMDDETVILDTGEGGRLKLARRAVAEKLNADELDRDDSEDVE